MRRQHCSDVSCAQLQALPAVPPEGQSAGTDTSESAQTTSASAVQSAALTICSCYISWQALLEPA